MKKLFYTAFALTTFFVFHVNYAQVTNYQKGNIAQAINNNKSLIKEGIYFLKIAETNKYAAIEGISNNNGAKLVQWEFSNNLNHQFQISTTSDAGFYYIKALHSNKFLNVEGQNTNDGTAICQWDFVNQDNLKWSFTYASSSQTYIIRNKQTGKALRLQTAIADAQNGVVLSINGNALAGTQNFVLQPVSITKVTNSGNLKTQAYVGNQIQLKLTDGTVVARQINPLYQTIKNTNTVHKRVIKTEKTDETCETKTAKIDMDTKDFVPVTASSYLEFNAPGLIYDIPTFYSGDYSNKQIFPYGENRNPITIATTVRNTAGAIFENIEVPTKNNINTAITNFQRNYATDRLLTTNQSLIYRSTYVENNTELALKIGAHGKYVGFSFDGNMQVSNSRNTKTFFIEAEKELFTLSTETPQGGFLNNTDVNAERLGYISSVSYGVKIIGKIEVENTAEIFKSQFKAIMDWGFAGGGVNFANLSSETATKTRCFFYVIGGTSEKVEGVSLADAYHKINQILSSVNYKTCMPIRMTFRSLTTGNPIVYKDVTNDFKYDVCTPKAIKEANKNLSIKVFNLNAIGTDIELYGDIWVELWSPKYGNLKAYATTANSLFSLKKNVHLEVRDLQRYANGLPEVMYKNIPAEIANDAELHIFYNLFDYNAIGSDDLLKQRGGSLVKMSMIGNVPIMYFRTIIPAKELFSNANGGSKQYSTDFVDGDGVTITFNINGSVNQAPPK